MKPYALFIITLTAAVLFAFCFSSTAHAKIEWEIMNNISLEDEPVDMAISDDGSTVYILCKKSILVYSFEENNVTDTIPLAETFSSITLTPDEEIIFLTSPRNKQISIMNVSYVYDLKPGQSPVIGKPGAPVSMTVFIDYQCPYCARIHPLLDMVLKKYPGQVNLVIKHFPLRMHKFAQKAAAAALAADRQGKYNEMSTALIRNFRSLNNETINKYAGEIGLDMQKFEKDMNDPAIDKIIAQDMNTGQEVKVRGVPALFINGKVCKARSFEALLMVVEKELNKGK